MSVIANAMREFFASPILIQRGTSLPCDIRRSRVDIPIPRTAAVYFLSKTTFPLYWLDMCSRSVLYSTSLYSSLSIPFSPYAYSYITNYMYFSFTLAILSSFWIVFEKFLIPYDSLGYFRVI